MASLDLWQLHQGFSFAAFPHTYAYRLIAWQEFLHLIHSLSIDDIISGLDLLIFYPEPAGPRVRDLQKVCTAGPSLSEQMTWIHVIR